jgi:hypothetical protein
MKAASTFRTRICARCAGYANSAEILLVGSFCRRLVGIGSARYLSGMGVGVVELGMASRGCEGRYSYDIASWATNELLVVCMVV